MSLAITTATLAFVKLIVTADLHYDIVRSREPTRALADHISTLDADALFILGDVAGRDVGIVEECLHLFDRFAGRKFFIAGNHDLWVDPQGDSLHRLEVELPRICEGVGFENLDQAPAIVNGVGIVGSVGWYDYRFRAEWLNIPTRFYEHKLAPGVADRMSEYRHLLDDRSDVPPESLQMGTRWMDGEHVRMDLSDQAFCDRLLQRFREHLDWAAARCERIVVGLHHLPFAELVPQSDDPRWAFACAFMGSPTFGEAILRHPQVSHVYCGHSHRGMCLHKGHVRAVNVGCTYADKVFDVLVV